MAGVTVTQGLDNSAKVEAGLAATTHIQTMSFDNTTGAAKLLAAHTAANSIGAIASFIAVPTSNTTIGAGIVQYEGSLTTAEFNGVNIGRILLHRGTTAVVTSASATLHGGIDDFLNAKTSQFGVIMRLQVTHRST